MIVGSSHVTVSQPSTFPLTQNSPSQGLNSVPIYQLTPGQGDGIPSDRSSSLLLEQSLSMHDKSRKSSIYSRGSIYIILQVKDKI